MSFSYRKIVLVRDTARKQSQLGVTMTEKCPFQFDLMNPMTHNKGLPFEAFATLRQECPVSFQDGAEEHG